MKQFFQSDSTIFFPCFYFESILNAYLWKKYILNLRDALVSPYEQYIYTHFFIVCFFIALFFLS